MKDFYPTSSNNTPENPETPEPVTDTTAETEQSPMIKLDREAFKTLQTLPNEEIEARAGDFGVTVNSGFVPIDVEGEIIYIDTNVDDFGTRARELTEREARLRSEKLQREVGDAALDNVALESPTETVDETPVETADETPETPADEETEETEEVKEIETVAADEFIAQANGVINELTEKVQGASRALEGDMEALQADRMRMRSLLEEVNQNALMLMRMTDGGEMGGMMRQLNSLQDLASRARMTLQRQTEVREGLARRSRDLNDESEQAIQTLNTRGYRFGSEVSEKMSDAKKDGRTVDSQAAQQALGMAQGVTVAMRQLQTAAETITTDVRRMEDVNEGALHGFMRIGNMCDDILGQTRYGRVNTEDISTLFRFVQMTAGEYDYEVGSKLSRLRASVDEVASARARLRPIH